MSQVLCEGPYQASLFADIPVYTVKSSKKGLKTTSWTFFIKNQPQTDAFEAFVKSLSTSSVSTAT